MNAILPASLVAIINYYTLLWRTPCVSISLLLFVGQSRVLTAWYKAFKWLQRVLLQQGSELSRLARLGGDVVDENDGLEREGDDDPDRSEGDEEIRLLRDQSRRERQSDVYAKWRTGMSNISLWPVRKLITLSLCWTDYSISHSHVLKVSVRTPIHKGRHSLTCPLISDN